MQWSLEVPTAFGLRSFSTLCGIIPSKDDLSHVQYARFTFPLPAAGCAPHLAYLSSLSLGGRTYSGLGWRIFSPPCFHPSGAPTVGHSIGIFVVLNTDVSTQCHTLCYYSLSSIQYLASSILWPCCLVASFGDTRQRCPNTGVNSASPSAPC